MEKVIYDIYIAEAEINANHIIFSSDSVRKQELFNSVLKKHKITEAKLDTSLAWYSGNLDKYIKINNNVSKRLNEAIEILRNNENSIAKKTMIAESSGIIFPVKEERFLLRYSDLPNKVYTFKADTTLTRYGGVYGLQLNILGVSGSQNPVVTLCIQCVDTTFLKQDTIISNGLFSTFIEIHQEKQAKALYGSIYFPEIYPGMGIFIQDFTLSFSNQPLSVAEPAKQVVPVSIQHQP